MDIVAFISARLDERQAAAEAAQAVDPGPWTVRALPPEWPRIVSEAGSHSGHAAAVVVAADGGELWDTYDSDYGDAQHAMAVPTAQHIALHDPTRVLADVKAQRAILAAHLQVPADRPGPGDPLTGCQTCHVDTHCGETEARGLCETIRHLAAPDNAHPDYDPAWRVDS